MTERHDVVVLGTGAAGLTAAVTAHEGGRRLPWSTRPTSSGARRRGLAGRCGSRTIRTWATWRSPTAGRRPSPTSCRSRATCSSAGSSRPTSTPGRRWSSATSPDARGESLISDRRRRRAGDPSEHDAVGVVVAAADVLRPMTPPVHSPAANRPGIRAPSAPRTLATASMRSATRRRSDGGRPELGAVERLRCDRLQERRVLEEVGVLPGGDARCSGARCPRGPSAAVRARRRAGRSSGRRHATRGWPSARRRRRSSAGSGVWSSRGWRACSAPRRPPSRPASAAWSKMA